MSWIWVYWWCFDDHLAASLGVSGLGNVPFWVLLLISLSGAASDTSIATAVVQKLKHGL